LAKPFPPARATACTRTWNIAKYLSRFGWDVTVVTPHPSVWRQIDDPDEITSKATKEGIKRILIDHRWRFLRPRALNCWNSGFGWVAGGFSRRIARHLGVNRDIGWIEGVEQGCMSLSNRDVDLILATGSPFASFRLAKQFSDRLGCPYVLDYRDPWTENPHRPSAPSAKEIEEERRLLASCAAATIVSSSWGQALDRRFALGSKLHIIPNGYDPEELANVKPYNFGHFAIVYAGNFYPPKRVITPIMAALTRLGETDREWFFHYYGRQEGHVMEEAKRFGVTEKIVAHGWVPQLEALSAVRGAGLTVVISSVKDEASAQDRGIMTGKVYEALGLKTPVLLVAPRGSDLEMIATGKSTVKCFSGGSVEEMAGYIVDLMSGSITRSEIEDNFAWPNIARELDMILRRAIGDKSDRAHAESSQVA
jgi:glycosyltransferase involved in cell wall biosynthesis